MTSPTLKQARKIVAQMPSSEARKLRSILTIPCNPRRRSRLLARECGSLGSLLVGHAYSRALSEMRRCA
jgi:hypothetical protein